MSIDASDPAGVLFGPLDKTKTAFTSFFEEGIAALDLPVAVRVDRDLIEREKKQSPPKLDPHGWTNK
jgi:hypothetical protein